MISNLRTKYQHLFLKISHSDIHNESSYIRSAVAPCQTVAEVLHSRLSGQASLSKPQFDYPSPWLNLSQEVVPSTLLQSPEIAFPASAEVNTGCSSPFITEGSGCIGVSVSHTCKRTQRNAASEESRTKRVCQSAPRVRNRRPTVATRQDGEGCSSAQTRAIVAGKEKNYVFADSKADHWLEECFQLLLLQDLGCLGSYFDNNIVRRCLFLYTAETPSQVQRCLLCNIFATAPLYDNCSQLECYQSLSMNVVLARRDGSQGIGFVRLLMLKALLPVGEGAGTMTTCRMIMTLNEKRKKKNYKKMSTVSYKPVEALETTLERSPPEIRDERCKCRKTLKLEWEHGSFDALPYTKLQHFQKHLSLLLRSGLDFRSTRRQHDLELEKMRMHFQRELELLKKVVLERVHAELAIKRKEDAEDANSLDNLNGQAGERNDVRRIEIENGSAKRNTFVK
ncbi:hypothetical protein Tco_0300213 [Tanacetum coccineum]